MYWSPIPSELCANRRLLPRTGLVANARSMSASMGRDACEHSSVWPATPRMKLVAAARVHLGIHGQSLGRENVRFISNIVPVQGHQRSWPAIHCVAAR